MLPDAYTIAAYYKEYFEIGWGYGNLLSFGCFDKDEKPGTLFVDPLVYGNGRGEKLNPGEITENVHSSWYISKFETYMPFQTIPVPDIKKDNAYS